MAASPRSPLAHFAKAVMLRGQGRAEEAIPEFETVVSFDRNWTYAIFMLGQCKFLTGWIEEAIPAVEHAIRLSPRDPAIGQWYWQIDIVHMLQSRLDEKARRGPGLCETRTLCWRKMDSNHRSRRERDGRGGGSSSRETTCA